MPELPDVEGYCRVFARTAAGRRVVGVRVPDRTLLRNTTPQALGRALRGRRLEEPSRVGKWLLAPAGEACVLMHFGMTGRLDWASPGAELHPHDRVVLDCEGGELRYRNMRKFGGVWLARDEAERERVLGPLGPDARGLSYGDFRALLEGSRAAVKAALIDQRRIAGVGNLMADEALWRAGIDPRTRCVELGARRLRRLHESLTAVVRETVPAGRIPRGPRWLTSARDEPGGPCPRCGARLRRATVGGRTAVWCPRCQRR